MDEKEILLKEYEVCQQDIHAGDRDYWTLSAIFIGLSTALLGGLIFGIISNESFFNNLFCQNEPNKILAVGLTVIIVGIAMIIILQKLKGWLRRKLFRAKINRERMREIEIVLRMDSWWRIDAIDKYHEMKKSTKCLEQKAKDIVKEIYADKTDDEKSQLESKIINLLKKIEFFKKCHFILQKKQNKNEHEYEYKYERPSSQKHYPCIIYTIMSLWVLVISVALFCIVDAYHCWYWGLFSGLLILIPYFICLIVKKFRETIF
jgi:hypothetical protein